MRALGPQGLDDNGNRAYSDSNSPQTLMRTVFTPPAGNPPAGTTAEWTPDGKSLWMRDANGVDTKIGPAAAGGAPATVKLTADLAASTLATLGNATGLSFAVAANTLYRYTFYVVYRTAATTTGIRLGVTTPTFTVHAGRVDMPQSADGTASVFSGALTTSGDSVVSASVEAATTDYLARIEGVLLPSAAGTLQVQFASEVALSGVTIRNGSHGYLYTL